MPPQQTGGSVPAAHMRALIPSSVMEFHLQRQYATAIFVALQAWKIKDLFAVYFTAYPELYNGIISKWWFIDAFFLIALYIAKIPWLQFTIMKTICLMFIACAFDLSVFSVSTVSTFYFYF